MKNIFRILLLAFIIPFFMQSCRDDEFATQTAEPSFKLYNTTLSSNVLYPTMKDNPFRLTWDNKLGEASEYTVLLSSTQDFAKSVTLGKTAGSSYTTTIGALNTALLQAGYTPYTAKTVYLKVVSGSFTSNPISFDVTPYPSAAPVITAPASGAKIVLNGTNPDDVASKITWNDYNYGTNVVYTVELAPKGTTNFVKLGTVNNLKLLNVSNLVMDQTVLAAGGKADVAADYDLRVTATTTSTGGTISASSSVVTVNITPYQLESYIYAPGGYQNWDPSKANTFVSSTSNGVYVGFINFPAAGTEFKFTKNRNWNDGDWGDNGADGTLEPGGANLKSPGAGYYKITVDINTKTYTMVPYSLGIVGAHNEWGNTGIADAQMNWDDAQRKFVSTLALPAGDFKFRLNNKWDENYGDSNKDNILDQNGDNLKTTAAGTYTITVDPFSMGYTIK